MIIPKWTSIPMCLCFLLLLGACRTGPIYNVKMEPIPTGQSETRLPMDKIQKAITMAGAGLGWKMVVLKPGFIVATLDIRSHQAVVDITYDDLAYSIAYKSGVNLKYDGSKISSQYNSWIHNLDNAIKKDLIGVAHP